MAQESSSIGRTAEDVASEEPSGRPPFRVFILEDDLDLAEVFEAWLHKHYGDVVTVHVAETIAEGEAILDDIYTLDLAIIDRKLPDGTGDELLELVIRRFDPITVMITATTPGPDLISLPIHDYFVKPIEEERLINGVSLLEKLKTANALDSYSDARKASLLEYHLDNPDSHPLFRRFAARWEYDRLEIADLADQAVVYELYIGDPKSGSAEDSLVHVSVAGGLAVDLEDLLDGGEVRAEGMLVPSGGDEFAWVKATAQEVADTSDGSIGIYQFTCPVPEQYVTDLTDSPGDISLTELVEVLEREYN